MEEKDITITPKTPEKVVPLETDKTMQESTEARIKRQTVELNELRKKQAEEKLVSEDVEGIKEHKHCAACQAVFWNPDKQITSCLRCNPGRVD